MGTCHRRSSYCSWSSAALLSSIQLISIVSTTCFSWTPTINHRQHTQFAILKPSSPQASFYSKSGGYDWSLNVASGDTATSTSVGSISDRERLETLAKLANDALIEHGSDIFKSFKARVAVMPQSADEDTQQNSLRLGLVATESIRKEDELVASLPFYDTDGSGLALAPHLATKVVYKDKLPEGYDGWTGDVGLLAMLVLNEMARLNVDGSKGVDLPTRKDGIPSLMSAWVTSLPSPEEMSNLHPLMWDEDDQEILQSSSTKKIYRLLDDIDDDSSWLDENAWSLDRDTFPETIKLQIGDSIEERQCFSTEGFRYAVSLVRSRSFFVDGSLRLLPYLDFANHDDYDSFELVGGGIGMLWGSAKGALLKSGKALREGDEVCISYGPKGGADYLLDHGFIPNMCKASSSGGAVTSELTFEVDDTDRFRDDKLDILEYETYDLAPMEPSQVFDVTGGRPDPAMYQFLRLVKLGGKDAFLLESIFRKEVWGFMSEPVSEDNEREVVTTVINACENALKEMDEISNEEGSALSPKKQLCALVRGSERQALERTLEYVKQEAEALDLKEYYQERRLKTLGLDSDWSPEDDDIAFGGSRVPGGADYDW
jgi:[ribulose-bisphosphate carboxylase]-lysine N-methyltransferase